MIDEETRPESDKADGSVSAYTKMKYCTDTVIVNGAEQKLYRYCYFVTEKPIESLVIKDLNISIVEQGS